jgi:hypothetical protein
MTIDDPIEPSGSAPVSLSRTRNTPSPGTSLRNIHQPVLVQTDKPRMLVFTSHRPPRAIRVAVTNRGNARQHSVPSQGWEPLFLNILEVISKWACW